MLSTQCANDSDVTLQIEFVINKEEAINRKFNVFDIQFHLISEHISVNIGTS